MTEPTTLESPTGRWEGPGFSLTAWTSGDMRETEFMYVWAECSLERVWPVEYRILRDGVEAVPWTAMADSARVFAKTGFVDEGGSPADTDPLGGAERLRAGVYELELRFSWNDHPYRFTGVRFEVAAQSAEHGVDAATGIGLIFRGSSEAKRDGTRSLPKRSAPRSRRRRRE